MPKSKPLDGFLSRLRRAVSPTSTAGAPGTAVFGGFIQSDEKNANLGSREERYKTYSEILANTSIVAAGTRYFLNLVGKATWKFVPSEADTDEKFAELAEEYLTEDPATPWHRIIRRAAMYRFYGFSIQEWTAKRREDGGLTMADVAPRAQLTIDQWDMNVDGSVLGVLQRSPQTMKSLYIPRQKMMYIVDDTLSDSPEGLGLFRHLVEPAQRLKRYEQLEGFGYETDLRGIPIGRAPFSKLQEMENSGEISKAQRIGIEKPMRDFIKNHTKTAKLGMLFDSITYETRDEAGKASNAKQWEVELLKAGATSFRDNANAIERLNRELARILGVEQLLLGESGGSFALAKSKTNSFFLLVDGTLVDVTAGVADDLIGALWRLNGWPEEMKPTPKPEAVRFRDVEQIAAALRDMATAGAILAPDDPVIGEIRDLMGVSPPTEVSEEDLMLAGREDEMRRGGLLQRRDVDRTDEE